MKALLSTALPVVCAALLFAGCDPCQKGFELKNDLATLDTLVTGTIATPGSLDRSCAEFRKWTNKLAKGAAYADRVANTYFADSYCASWHEERRCGWMRDPWDPGYPGYPTYPHYPRHWNCGWIRVCDRHERRERDGFTQAKELSAQLSGVSVDLVESCVAHDRGEDLAALASLAKAKLRFAPAERDAEYVLNRAGCYKREGN